MSNRASVETAIGLFFEAINSNDASVLPLSENVEYRGILTPDPKRGEAEVREHIEQVAPFVLNLSRYQTVIENNSAAVLVDFEGVNGVRVEGAYFLQLENGEFSQITAVFDSRPLFAGSAG
jgi:hypothetical protein